MRLPFISRRRHEAAVRLATAAIWHFVEQAEDQTTAELGRRLDAEYALADAHRKLGQERAKRDQLKAYMVLTGAVRYEKRLARALRAVACLRDEAATQRRVTRHLTDQLLNATGYQGEPLLPEGRRVLDLDTPKEDQ